MNERLERILQWARSQQMLGYMRQNTDDGEIGKVRYLVVEGEWTAIVPGDERYESALPDRYSRDDGMAIPPWHEEYDTAVKKRRKKFGK